MEPLSMILTALATGAAAAATDTASQAVKDAYAALKARVQKKLQAKDATAATVVAEFEKDPETWKQPMQSLAAAAVESDTELIEEARRVLQIVHPEQHAQGKFNVQVTGEVRGQVIGDRASQHNVFGKE